MNYDPIISVVMPVYNCSNYINLAIESILNQTFEKFEFIIINDASTDDTLIKILEYDDPRIVLLENTTQKGICECINYGISISKGKYIARMDGDDISHNTRFEHQFVFMEENPSVGILGTWYTILGTNDIIKMPVKHEAIVLDMLEYSPLAHPTIFLRKSVLKDLITIYDQQYIYAEDYELWSRLILTTRAENLPICLLAYRKHDNQSSNLYFLEQRISAKRVRLNLLKLLYHNFEVDLNSYELKAYLEKTGHSYNLISDTLEKIDKLLISNLELKLFHQNLLKKKLLFKKIVVIRYFLKRQDLLNKIKYLKKFLSVLTSYYYRQIIFSKFSSG